MQHTKKKKEKKKVWKKKQSSIQKSVKHTSRSLAVRHNNPYFVYEVYSEQLLLHL